MPKPLAAALVLLLAAVAPAAAGEARASGNTPVRAGPGEHFRVIGKLVDGKRYEVLDCTREANFCLVADGEDILGWARGSYLVGSAAKAAVTPYEFLQPDFHRLFPTP